MAHNRKAPTSKQIKLLKSDPEGTNDEMEDNGYT
jgi:hypothetical protein